MHDKFKRRFRAAKADERLRRQIAREAARRLFATVGPAEGEAHLREASESEYYTAKRKAAAVLGHKVRPGDLPTDSEVRAEVLDLARSKVEIGMIDEPESDEPPARLADHIDRFALYKLRLEPLAAVKQNPKYHPEGDALYHSLQVFEKARAIRPYDEEFLLAALLHDVGKGVDPRDHVAAGLEALRGALTERTAWLIEHHMDPLALREQKLSPRARAALEACEWYDDLMLLRELDEAGRDVGAPVGTIDEALAYLRGLEAEDYLRD
ncbi:MAG TPA: HD domain-containing protein [Isosphaeraceae bacterium]|jgi:hypothetical protein|nr:HD domain-containing protein [Isosphaeraceae bacterium]